MNLLLKEVRHNPMLWLLAFVPVVFAAATLKPEAHTLHFVLSVLAIVPLAALLSHATESVAAKTGDAAGGLLNATLGNLTELVIALTALRAGEYMLVKASIAGAIVTNALFMLGASFLLGGLKYHVQEYNRVSARMQAGMLFLASVALLVPSAVATADSTAGTAFTEHLSVGLSVLLIVAYGLGMLFSLKTHRELFASAGHAEEGEAPWPMGLALVVLAGVTILVALVSEMPDAGGAAGDHRIRLHAYSKERFDRPTCSAYSSARTRYASMRVNSVNSSLPAPRPEGTTSVTGRLGQFARAQASDRRCRRRVLPVRRAPCSNRFRNSAPVARRRRRSARTRSGITLMGIRRAGEPCTVLSTETKMTTYVLTVSPRNAQRIHAVPRLMVALAAACTILISGCATQAGSGAAIGTGIGALAGQLIGGDTEATLVGAAVGAGVGYLIGNERDKESAARMRAEEATAPLGGTRWEVVDWAPREDRVQFASKIVEFRPDGRVVTTTTYRDGASHVDNESYRIAGDTLIVNKPGYIINYRYAIDGGRMTLRAERMRATLRRI